jgi:hypothetical protein
LNNRFEKLIFRVTRLRVLVRIIERFHSLNNTSEIMATTANWLDLLATLKAGFDFAKSGIDYATAFRMHKAERDTQAEARRASKVFVTYSDVELRAIIQKIEDCQTRFILQGGGKDRHSCLCSIFNEVIRGNGGRLPVIDDWKRMYNELNCPTPS